MKLKRIRPMELIGRMKPVEPIMPAKLIKQISPVKLEKMVGRQHLEKLRACKISSDKTMLYQNRIPANNREALRPLINGLLNGPLNQERTA